MKLITLLVFIIFKLHFSSCAGVNDCPISCTCYLYTLNELRMTCDSAKPISFIPTNLSVPVSSITSLTISGGLNDTIPTNICQYSQLTSLDFFRSTFTSLTSSTLQCLTMLQTLGIYSSQLKYIGNDSLCLKNLTKLYVWGNQINQFSPNCQNSKLTYIDLGYNNLSNLTRFNLKSINTLQVLRLENNNISYVDCDAFRNITSLRSLYLDNNRIDQISFDKCQFSQLSILSMTYNQFTNLSNSNFKFIQTLQYLDLSYNQINFISDYTFDNLTNLGSLYLSNNEINHISQYFFTKSLVSLSIIDLSYNNLTPMELWPTYLQNARSINLQHNQISKFTNEFGWSISNQSSQWSNSYLWSRNIDLQNNGISSFGITDLQQYGICNLTDYQNLLVNVFRFFNMNNNPISCNCSNTLYNLQSIYLYGAQCSKPTSYAGKSILTYDSCTNLSNFIPTNSTICNQMQKTTLQTTTLQTTSFQATSFQTTSFQTTTLQTTSFQTTTFQSSQTSQLDSTQFLTQATTESLIETSADIYTPVSPQITTEASTLSSSSN